MVGIVGVDAEGAGAPLVSVGLPVHNGDNFLEAAIRSVLSQTLDDVELVVSDNASTDRTAEICRDFRASDRRVVYRRNPVNLGAAPNYDLAFAAAGGRYFKWLAHDDVLTPTYLERTVGMLERRPDAVLCNSIVEYIDAADRPLGEYDSGLDEADRARPSDRFAAMTLRSHSCVDFFGVQRRSAMRGSLLHARFHGADRAYLAQMALRGRLIQLKLPLVRMREHPGRYTRRKTTSRERLLWHDAGSRKSVSFPTFHLYGEYWRIVQTAGLSQAERRRCRAVLAKWWFGNWNAVRAGVDVLAIAAPGAVGLAEQVKNRLFGAAPGHFIGMDQF
jgi:glycosyltransferase involved in cell wall biosynthesis